MTVGPTPPPGDWKVDGEEFLLNPDWVPDAEPEEVAAAPVLAPATPAAPDESPPTVEQIVEAMLFVGGVPLSGDAACRVVRGLSGDRFFEAIETLNRRYKSQRRPYSIQHRDGGYVIQVQPAYRAVRERLFGGLREARLTQPALDVLSLVAYRQPVTKSEIDSVRGVDSSGILRQLIRLGLVAVSRRGDAGQKDVSYGTTPRFLQLFSLQSLDDLPRLGEPQKL